MSLRYSVTDQILACFIRQKDFLKDQVLNIMTDLNSILN